MSNIFETPPLQRYLLHKTRDIKAIQASVAEIFCPHKVKVSGSGPLDRDALMHHAPLPNGAIIYLVYGTEIRVDVSQLEKFSTEYKERFGESPSDTLKAQGAAG